MTCHHVLPFLPLQLISPRHTTIPSSQIRSHAYFSRLRPPPMEIPEQENSGSLHTGAFLHKLTVPLIVPKSAEKGRFSVFVVMLSHHFFHCLGCFLRMIKRDGGYKVVDDMGSHDVVEEMCVDESEIAIDGGCSTTDKGPLRMGVMRKSAIRMLEKGYEDC